MRAGRSAHDARRTRDRLVAEAAAMATVDGLERLTIGRLAGAAHVSRSGVSRHFGNTEALRLATIAHGLDVFARAVPLPVASRPAGLTRLLAICERWTEYLAGDVFPGGCFLAATSAEVDGREGPVHDAVRRAIERWLAVLADEVRTAVDVGELAPGTDPETLAYELNGLALAANQARQLLGDDGAPARSLALMRRAVLAHATPAAVA